MSHIRYHDRYTRLQRGCAGALALCLAGMRPAPLSAQGSVHPRPPVVAHATLRDGAITIDGKLDEPAWQRAAPITAFRQYTPAQGAPATLKTEVRILYDANALYIGARMSEPGGVVAPLARRDQLLDGNGNNGSFNSLTTDKFVVDLDPYHNHLDDALFEVNPAGVKGDQFNGDPSWDPIWEAAAHVDATGWTAEMRIPYSQLRFSRDSLQTWGLQLWRYIDRLNEQDMWAYWRQNESGGPAFYGHLTGLVITDRPRQMELLPYVESREQFRYAPPADPFHRSSENQLRAGADVKYLLTSNLTLDATINPDFGQVEVDPASLNLSAFETFYQEKRPFFIAGSSAFSYGGMNCMFCSNASGLGLFYSRRIGRLPQLNGYVDNLGAYADTPDNTTILGAAKITGRTAGGYTVGVLDALTNRESARYVSAPGGPVQTQAVEPLTNYFVGRLKRDFNDGTTTVGGIVTSTARRLSDSVLTDRLHSHAEAAGLDFTHRWGQRQYSWTGDVALSSVTGSPSAITLTEQSSAHYFQRPDRRVSSDGLFSTRYDSLATALRGYALYTRVAKDNGNWMWEVMSNVRSPGFEVNDLAYLDRADYVWTNANVGRQWTVPTSWYRSMGFIVGGEQRFDYDGYRTDQQLQAFYQIDLLNYWRVRLFEIHHPVVDDDRLTRGGPVVRRTGYDFRHFQVSTDARRRAVFDLTLEGGHGIGAHTHTFIFSPGVALKPAANVFIQFSPTYAGDEDPAQYVTTVSDPTATAFYGHRYVFAFIRTKTLSLDTRVNWTFTPNLTLQLFAQPFFATGDYGRFREFAAPHSVKKLNYGTDIGTITHNVAAATYTVDPDGSGPAKPFTFADPNFASRSLRGNAVLRWEYRPGSTVYFVWTQTRAGVDGIGTFNFAQERAALFRDRPTNIFQIKVNYWLGR